ncbi:MAG: peptidoglycan glycosyltransferase [Lachnospiraceae bacterium]|jgi:stage V sporulation protein D (sporulation-specific penicillin-binding protein)|nr:peptidoglycan glycosyltransferase [Lachnospiraceae bacterium]
MQKTRPFHRRKVVVIFFGCAAALCGLGGRLGHLMVADSEYYAALAQDLHERERDIKAARGRILDRNGVVLADNRTVCTVSVIHSQIKEPERVIEVLAKELSLEEETVRKRVEKVSSIERVKKNVEKEIGDRIRNYNLAGVKVDEDYRRYYPYDDMASKVLGFTGSDNQGIIGLEVEYEEELSGEPGKILTLTDARGVELENTGESRLEPVAGNDLVISLDYNIQEYAQQAALKVMEQKQADSVSIIILNPMNGEIYAMTNVPEFNLNEPFTLLPGYSEEEGQDALNKMWRNGCINDTYEPGSTFKVITAAAGLEAGVVSLTDQFSCPGFKIVEDRRIRCARVSGHGGENFVQATQNSCNPVFIEVGLRLGVDRYFSYFEQFGLKNKTGIDLPGEAATIMHKKENVGQVELATISFGQSFQITPIQLATTVSSIINGGKRITPHFGVQVKENDGTLLKVFQYEEGKQIVSEETSETMRYLLEQVVDGGGGKNAYIEGYRIGGKTATSETLPRSANKYISSFLGFTPANEPKVLGLCIINNPQGVYYGGTIAAPVIREMFENILPYLGIEKTEETVTEVPG